jgi:hypothetical protein
VARLGLDQRQLALIQQLGIHFELGWGAWITLVAAAAAGFLALLVSPRG